MLGDICPQLTRPFQHPFPVLQKKANSIHRNSSFPAPLLGSDWYLMKYGALFPFHLLVLAPGEKKTKSFIHAYARC